MPACSLTIHIVTCDPCYMCFVIACECQLIMHVAVYISSHSNGRGKCAAGSGELASMRGMMEVEYRAAVRMVAAPDFLEGVRCSAQPVDHFWHIWID